RQRKERLQRENFIRHFIGDIPELQNFSPEDINEESHSIGKGRQGEVYPGYIRSIDRNVITKKPRRDTARLALQRELEASEELKQRLKHQLGDLTEDMAKFQGFSGVVTVLGQTSNGYLIQKRVHGENLYDLLKKPKDGAFYDKRLGGFPQDLMEAKRKALEFATIVQSIHSLGMLHSDLFLRNIMLDEKGHVRVVDLGFCAENCSRPVREDILREMFFLHAVFFGAIYIEAGYPDDVPKSQQWLEKYLKGKSLEQRKAYFLSQCRDFNQQMRNRMGKAYSEETIGRLSRLMARMADPDPDIRPNSKEVCEELTEIWLLPEPEG
ncbi:MAG: protein kinase, partial [Puniceicoccales bacterium]|nr:protein kinase [Puniceicoccales bacterium]